MRANGILMDGMTMIETGKIIKNAGRRMVPGIPGKKPKKGNPSDVQNVIQNTVRSVKMRIHWNKRRDVDGSRHYPITPQVC